MSSSTPDTSNTPNSSHTTRQLNVADSVVEPSNDAAPSTLSSNVLRLASLASFLRMPRNVYLLYFFTLGKGFQL